jgi:hypothetical protein
MRRTILTTCFTLACGAALLSAQTASQSQSGQSSSTNQTSTSSSRNSGEARSSAKGSVTLTGCLQAGTEPNTFVLNNVSESGAQSSAHSRESQSTSQAGSTGSSSDRNPSEMARTDTSYVLVPNNKKMDLSQHIGQRVEVTGSLVPGHSKTGMGTGSSSSSSTMGSSGSPSSSSSNTGSTGSSGSSGSSTTGTMGSAGNMGSMGSMGQMQLKVRSIHQVSPTCP